MTPSYNVIARAQASFPTPCSHTNFCWNQNKAQHIFSFKIMAEETSSSQEYPWQQGPWGSKVFPSYICSIEGNKFYIKQLVALDYPDIAKTVMSATWTLGDTVEAPKEFKEATGFDKYNMEINYVGALEMKQGAYLHENGTKVSFWGMTNSLEEFEAYTEDQVEKLREDREPYDAPPNPYLKNPGGPPGKMYWISGPPGAGKSTTCQLLARKKDFVYFEADCCLVCANPYVDPNIDNPSIAGFKQKPLKGMPKDLVDAVQNAADLFQLMQTADFDTKDVNKVLLPLAMNMSKMIKQERERLGGTWAIAQAIPSRFLRDQIRAEIGPDLVFIVLNMTKECQKDRLKHRHGEAAESFNDVMSKFYDTYEPAGEDEENAINVEITEDLSPDDVMEKVLEAIEKHK